MRQKSDKGWLTGKRPVIRIQRPETVTIEWGKIFTPCYSVSGCHLLHRFGLCSKHGRLCVGLHLGRVDQVDATCETDRENLRKHGKPGSSRASISPSS